MPLNKEDMVEGTAVRYIDTTWPNWYNKRAHLYGKVITSSIIPQDMFRIAFYNDPEYEQYVCTESWKCFRFILENRLTDTKELSRTKLERKCRKLWNNSNWVKANSSRAY